ncbi:hypothetical protein [Pedobacter sp. Leaf216]|uniref:hypothetical protein n=1 Tax=Pedobacter sp. Leaf216 TaxID=1735684 RepID=UPI001F24CD2E|nr:hypothetical protein [Pedobacter sp. Leaf216]
MIEIFKSATTDIKILNERQELIKYLSNYSGALNFDRTNMDFVESYLLQNSKIKSYSRISALTKAANYFFYPNQAYYLKEKGVGEIVFLLKKLAEMFAGLSDEVKPALVKAFDEVICTLFKHQLVKEVVERSESKITIFELEQLDLILRGIELKTVKLFLDLTYQVDAYFAVVKAARKYNFTLPHLNLKERNLIIKGVFHPFLNQPTRMILNLKWKRTYAFLQEVIWLGNRPF